MRTRIPLLSCLLTAALCLSSMPATAMSALSETAGKKDPYRVFVLNFDPVFPMAEQKRQHELMPWWNDPYALAETFQADMAEISYGNATYEIAQWVDAEELPKSTNGKAYTLDYYYETLMTAYTETSGAYWSYPGWEDYGRSFAYEAYLEEYDIFNRVNAGEIDEVWVFAGPMVGVTPFETIMVGENAYWCNGDAIEHACKPFVVYGFNYERGVGEMLEDAGHRTESIMKHIMGEPDYTKPYADYTDWEKFTAYDKVAPGKAGVGNVHFAPNSPADYAWGDDRKVLSNCEDWLNYPNMTAQPEAVNCAAWGNGDIRAHHKWWFARLPHAAGVNAATGYYNNWWTYFTLDYINRPPTEPFVMGDVNADGVFDCADVVTLQGWLLQDGTVPENWRAADFCEDACLNAMDLSLMKRRLCEGQL